jgi:outer membrane protein TolC
LAKAVALSPELQEAKSLVAAGKSETWSNIFGFITGSSLSVATGNDPNAGGQSLTGNEQISIGGAYFPEIALSNENVSELNIRVADVPKELGEMIQASLSAANQAADQVDETSNALVDATSAYQATKQLYIAGGIDLLQLTTAESIVTTSAVAHAQALIDLDGQRITLNRVLIKNAFTKIPTCVIKGTGDTGFFGWLKGIFDPGDMTTIDQVCKPSTTAAHQAA